MFTDILDKELSAQVRIYACLRVLDPVAAQNYVKYLGWTDEYAQTIAPAEFGTPEVGIMCLQLFLENGIWPGFLFSSVDAWAPYLLSIADPQYHVGIREVMRLAGPTGLLLFFNLFYKFGKQPISDADYDALERLYKQTFTNLHFLDKYTPDDLTDNPIVLECAKLCGFGKAAGVSKIKLSGNGDTYSALNAEKSTSIKPVRSYQEAYDFLCNAPNVETHWSLKVDGINVKMLYKADGAGLEIALSRGRATDSWDYTQAVQNVLIASGADVSKLKGKITGEAMVSPDSLPALRLKYPDKDYKTPKSTAAAMLRAPQQFEVADYQYLKLFPFEVEDTPKDIAFSLLSDAKLSPPPELKIGAGAIPLASLDEFSKWLDNIILDPLWDACQRENIGSDGVVLQLLSGEETERADKYSDLNIALKFSHWSEAEYTGKVINILFEQQRVEMSVVLEIEPVITRDLNVATRISVGSSAILIADNIRVGDVVRFTRKSEAINIYLSKVGGA